jgi:hypothetical protein
MHGIDVRRVFCEDLLVELLGLLQSPGLVVLQCQIEDFLGRELRHER